MQFIVNSLIFGLPFEINVFEFEFEFNDNFQYSRKQQASIQLGLFLLNG